MGMVTVESIRSTPFRSMSLHLVLYPCIELCGSGWCCILDVAIQRAYADIIGVAVNYSKDSCVCGIVVFVRIIMRVSSDALVTSSELTAATEA